MKLEMSNIVKNFILNACRVHTYTHTYIHYRLQTWERLRFSRILRKATYFGKKKSYKGFKKCIL